MRSEKTASTSSSFVGKRRNMVALPTPPLAGHGGHEGVQAVTREHRAGGGDDPLPVALGVTAQRLSGGAFGGRGARGHTGHPHNRIDLSILGRTPLPTRVSRAERPCGSPETG